MKKGISAILILALLLSLCACGGNAGNEPTQEPLRLATVDDPEEDIILTNGAYAVAHLRDNLKFPDTLEVHSITTKTAAGAYFYLISYSAENSLGQRVQDTICIRFSANKIGKLAWTNKDIETESEEAMEWFELYKGAEASEMDLEIVMALLELID